MSGKNSRRLGRVLVLALSLGLAGAWPGVARVSGRGEAQGGAQQQEGLLARAWEWLASWSWGLPGAKGLSRVWAAEGPGLDPNGGRSTGTPPVLVSPTTDMGPGIDPNGGH